MRGFILAAIGFVAALVLLSEPAVAETAGADSRGIEEVVVTARRREESVQEVPIPITALSADQLRDRGITEIKNIEKVTPNLSFLNSGVNRGTAQVFLRGIGQVNWGPTQDPKVGIYVDNVYLGRPQGAVFDLFDISRVEVLRGPQGTLFGRNTTAGLVHVITNDPTDEWEFKISGGFGNDEQINSDVLINVPMIEGVLNARLALQTRKDDGYMEDNLGRKWNQTDSSSARGKLMWTPTDSIEVMLSGEVFVARETAGLGQCVGGVPGGAAGLNGITDIYGRLDDMAAACTEGNDWYKSNDNDPNGSDVTTRALTLDAKWDVGGVSLRSITAWRNMDEINQSWGWATDFNGELSNGLEVIGTKNSPYEQWSQEFRIEGSAFNDRVTWIGGVYGFRESATQKLDVPFWRGLQDPPPDPAEAPLYYFELIPGTGLTLGNAVADPLAFDISRQQETHATNKSWAVFAEATIDITEKFAVTAGYRWTEDTREFKRFQFKSDGSFDTGNFCPGMPLDANGFATETSCYREKTFNQSTPRVILNYDLTDDMMVYLSFSKGYSSGGFNGDVRMRPFEPEISDNWEAGMKSQWFDNRLQFNMTAFQTDYENQQITVSRIQNGNPTADLINAQKATIEGIEFEIQANPFAGLYITASAGFIDGDYDEFSTIDTEFVIGPGGEFIETEFINDFSDIEFVGGAPVTYSISAQYEFETQAGTIAAGAGWAFRGRTYNTLRRFKSSRQGKYGLLDGRIRWDLPNGKTTVELWGTNLLDREYYRAALDLPNAVDADGNTVGPDGDPIGADLGHTTLFPSEPRRYGLTLTHSFGN